MSDRFSEIKNAKWCKLCSANVIEGQPHPDEDAHLSEQLKKAEASQAEASLREKLTATSSLIPVSSNDMLRHIAQPSSPETLCGRLITDRYRPSTTDLVCDICADLSQSSFIVEGDEPVTASKEVTATNYTRDGYKIDDDGFTVLTSEEETFYPLFAFDRFITSASEMQEVISDEEPIEEEVVYLGSYDDEPVQFTAHWLEEDNEEPLFLPNDEL